MAREQEQPPAKRSARLAPAPLNPLEAAVIDLFVQVSHALGQPRSVAEVYGLLFTSVRPMAMNELMGRLRISRPAVSASLTYLHSAGAIKMVLVTGNRLMHYEAVAGLRTLATRFLQDQIFPHLDGSVSRLDHIAGLVKQMPPEDRARVSARVALLQSWARKSRRFLPMVIKLMNE